MHVPRFTGSCRRADGHTVVAVVVVSADYPSGIAISRSIESYGVGTICSTPSCIKGIVTYVGSNKVVLAVGGSSHYFENYLLLIVCCGVG